MEADQQNFPTDSELLTKLCNREDAFVERKLFSDTDDWLRTAVAFANTCPRGFYGVLFVGVKEDGTVQEQQNVDSVQAKVAKKINEAYPQIFYSLKILEKGGRQFIAAIIPGSAERPHFVGGAYIRQGSSNMPANDSLFNELIAQRSSKAYTIKRWINRTVTLKYPGQTYMISGTSSAKPGHFTTASIRDCGQFYVSFRVFEGINEGRQFSEPLSRLEISFDDANSRLMLIVLSDQG